MPRMYIELENLIDSWVFDGMDPDDILAVLNRSAQELADEANEVDAEEDGDDYIG
jgi:hypothetical protein